MSVNHDADFDLSQNKKLKQCLKRVVPGLTVRYVDIDKAIMPTLMYLNVDLIRITPRIRRLWNKRLTFCKI